MYIYLEPIFGDVLEVKLVFPWNPTNLPDCDFVADGARVHEEDFIANPILYKTSPISCLVFGGFMHG